MPLHFDHFVENEKDEYIMWKCMFYANIEYAKSNKM